MTTVNAANIAELRTQINLLNNDTNEPHTINLTGSSYPVSDFVPNGNYLSANAAFAVITRNITIQSSNQTLKTIERTSATAFRIFAVNAKTSGRPNARLTLKNIRLLNAGASTLAVLQF